MLGLNSKVRIISRVIKYITDKSDFPKNKNNQVRKNRFIFNKKKS